MIRPASSHSDRIAIMGWIDAARRAAGNPATIATTTATEAAAA
jgi:hypothetical protein